jgi:hypothetical protein
MLRQDVPVERGRTLLVAALLLGAGCTGGGGPAASEAPSPFAVDGVPDGYALEAAGAGTRRQEWAQDDVGSDEPITVLVADDPAGPGPDAVVVSQAGLLPEALPVESVVTPATGGHVERFELDGREAAYVRDDGSTGAPLHPWVGELVVERGDDVAVRVRAVRSTRDDLLTFARAAEAGARHDLHPEVRPPAGYRIAGWLDHDAAAAIGASVSQVHAGVPGTRADLALGWSDGEGSVVVVAAPGRSAQLEALDHVGGVGAVLGPSERIDDAERPAWFVRHRWSEEVSLMTTTSWGDVLVVTVRGGADDRSLAERLAEGVDQASEAEWADLVAASDGGPGLLPDPGRQEVLRGVVGSQRWLLQSSPRADGVDECLRVEDHRRVCGYRPIGGSSTWQVLEFETDARQRFPAHLRVLATTTGARYVRVTTDDDERRARLVAVPGRSGRVAIVFLEGDERRRLTCRAPVGAHELRVELLDEAGEVVACAGPGR